MEWKDYVIIGLAILVVVGPAGVHFWHRGKGPIPDQAKGEGLIDDYRRLGLAISRYGGKALQEGAKLIKQGPAMYNNTTERRQLHVVGAA